jgi:hypothetical protein
MLSLLPESVAIACAIACQSLPSPIHQHLITEVEFSMIRRHEHLGKVLKEGVLERVRSDVSGIQRNLIAARIDPSDSELANSLYP